MLDILTGILLGLMLFIDVLGAVSSPPPAPVPPTAPVNLPDAS